MPSSRPNKSRFLIFGALTTIIAIILILVLFVGSGLRPKTEAQERTPSVVGNALLRGEPGGEADQASTAERSLNTTERDGPGGGPDIKERLRANLVVSLQNSYGKLFLENGLSAEQSGEACSLMVDQQMEMLNLLRPRPGEPPPPIQEVERVRISQQDQLREKLGEKASAALNQFNRDRSASTVVSRLEESARSSGVSFGSEQLEQVRSVLAKERVSKIDVSSLPPIDVAVLRQNQAVSPGPPPVLPENPVLQEVRSILTPEQVLLLEKVLKTRPPRPKGNR
jgi:hypothetical protein